MHNNMRLRWENTEYSDTRAYLCIPVYLYRESWHNTTTEEYTIFIHIILYSHQKYEIKTICNFSGRIHGARLKALSLIRTRTKEFALTFFALITHSSRISKSDGCRRYNDDYKPIYIIISRFTILYFCTINDFEVRNSVRICHTVVRLTIIV